MADVQTSPEKLVKVYLKIKGKKAELEAELKATIAPLEEQMETIKTALLEHCKEHNVESVRTDAGTFFRQVRTKYFSTDWAAMGQFVVEHNLPDLYEKRLNQTNMKQFIEENPEVEIPGLNQVSEYSITVRKA